MRRRHRGARYPEWPHREKPGGAPDAGYAHTCTASIPAPDAAVPSSTQPATTNDPETDAPGAGASTAIRRLDATTTATSRATERCRCGSRVRTRSACMHRAAVRAPSTRTPRSCSQRQRRPRRPGPRGRPYSAAPRNVGLPPAAGNAHTCTASTPVVPAAPKTSAAHPRTVNGCSTRAPCTGVSTTI